MLGSAISAIASAHKANKAAKEEQRYYDDVLRLDSSRPGYNGAALAAQSVNPLYDKNINLAKSYEPLSKVNNLPGQAYMENRINNNAANAVAQGGMAGFSSPSQYVQLLAAATGNQRQAHTDLSIAGAQNRMANQDKYVSSLTGANVAKAEEQDKAWNQNIWEPYAEQKNRAYGKWIDAGNRKNQWRAQQQQAGAQTAQDAGNFSKSFFTKGMGGSGGNTQQTVNAPQDRNTTEYGTDPAMARGQGASISWQKRGRGF